VVWRGKRLPLQGGDSGEMQRKGAFWSARGAKPLWTRDNRSEARYLLLAVDIGNTNICLGVFKDKKLLHSWRLVTNKETTSDEYGLKILTLLEHAHLQTKMIKNTIVSSVVPPLTPALIELSRKYFHCEPLVVTAETKTALKIVYPNPQEIGADRIVNAVAGYHLFGGPLIIVDFGTATTFDCITQKGEYLGGAIAPGIAISADALYTHTAKLPKVEIMRPTRVIGRSTVESMQSGLFYGYVGLVEELIHRCQNELSVAVGFSPPKVKVIATGGLAKLIASETKLIKEVIPNLTLEGLRLIWNYNREGVLKERR